MKRRILTSFSVLLFLLALAVAVLWSECHTTGHVRILFSAPIYTRHGGINGRTEIWARPEGFYVQVGTNPMIAGVGTRFDHLNVPGVSLLLMSQRGWGYEATISYWLVLAVLGFLACGFLVLARKQYLDQSLLTVPCPTCGYDLRASREKCPECGAVIGAPRIVDKA